MRQYINLYRGFAKKPSSGRGGLVLLVVVLLALPLLGAYAVMQQREITRLQAEADALEARAKAGHARLADLAKRMSQRDAAADSSHAGLEARYQARERILAALASGALGRDEGYSEYLRALAHRSGKGVWLTGFSVAQGGATLSLSGRALEAERIPAYLVGLNGEKIFKGRGFAALRVKQLPDTKGTDGKPASSPVEFTLGTEREEKSESATPEAELMGKVK